MRDISRIDTFCDRLAIAWKNVPDYRFGQLMCVIFYEYVYQTRKYPFFPEEDEMISFIEDWTAKHSPYNREV